MIFFSTLGGLLTFGLPGFIIGPIIAALFVTVWDIYGVEFKDWLPQTNFIPHSQKTAGSPEPEKPEIDDEVFDYLNNDTHDPNQEFKS